MTVGGKRHAPVALPRERDPLSIVQEAGWAPGALLDACEKSRHNPGFDTRIVQPVAIRYTD
jgi:hypothetical protein